MTFEERLAEIDRLHEKWWTDLIATASNPTPSPERQVASRVRLCSEDGRKGLPSLEACCGFLAVFA